jgi:hypothetical protein
MLSEAVKMKSIYAVDRSGDGKKTLSIEAIQRGEEGKTGNSRNKRRDSAGRGEHIPLDLDQY